MASVSSGRSTVLVTSALVALSALAAPLKAQAPSPWSGGLVMGINRSSVIGSAPVEARLGPVAGLFGTYRLSPATTLRAETAFSQMVVGQQICAFEGCAVGAVALTTRFSYFEMPVLFEVRPPVALFGIHPFAYAGPYAALRLACRQSSTNPAVAFDEVAVTAADLGVSSYPCPASFTSTQAGAMIGGGVAVHGAAVSVRWNRGFTSLATPPVLDANGDLVNGKASRLALVVELTPALGRRR